MRKIVLFQPEKPGNCGNIIRLCMALDFTLALIYPLSFELSDKALKRAGMDYVDLDKIEKYQSLDDFMSRHKSYDGYFVTRYGNNTYSEMDFSDYSKDQFYMFGKESKGLPHELLASHKENCIRIPMAIDARSLNLADSVAIIASEVNRQQHYRNLSLRESIKNNHLLK